MAGHRLSPPGEALGARCAACGADLFIEAQPLSPAMAAALRANGAVVADDIDQPGGSVYACGAAMLACPGPVSAL